MQELGIDSRRESDLPAVEHGTQPAVEDQEKSKGDQAEIESDMCEVRITRPIVAGFGSERPSERSKKSPSGVRSPSILGSGRGGRGL